jgi:GH35 family endo-1,4-beta-xylanase
VTSASALSTKVKFGAVLPILGKLPATSTGLPLSVTELDIVVSFSDFNSPIDYHKTKSTCFVQVLSILC